MNRTIKFRGKDKKPRKRRSGAYKGMILNAGYLYAYLPSHPNASGPRKIYYALHRLVAEWKLGRRLNPQEIVHHIDEDTLNNHPDNLEVMSASEHNKLTASKRLKDQNGKFK